MPFSAPFPYSKKRAKRGQKGADFYIILYTFYKTKSPKYRLNKPYFGLFHMFLKKLKVDLAGIEPASENLFRTVSPITVFILTFPPSAV